MTLIASLLSDPHNSTPPLKRFVDNLFQG
jgi:hypothetical protein